MMYKILAAVLLSAFMLTAGIVNAQRIAARINVPGVSIGVNTGQQCVWGRNVYGRGYKRRVMMQRARVNSARRMAMYDGYITPRERAIIRMERRQLARMTNGSVYGRGF